MGEALDFVRTQDAYFLVGLSVLCLILVVYSGALARRIARIERSRSATFASGSVGPIADCLADHSKMLEGLMSRDGELAAGQESLDRELVRCLRSIGIVRFNAFDDVGGEQSFALALLDARRNGIVVSSLYGRQDSRLYSKVITNGEGDRALSDEEKRAVREALSCQE